MIEQKRSVAHELRTPLSTILGFGQLLAMEDLTTHQQECADQIVSAGRRLLGLIESLVSEDGALRLPEHRDTDQ